MSSTEFHEIRCENCRTSFPPETKRCIHCGGPLGGGLAALLRQRPTPGGQPAPAEGAAARAPVPIAEEEDEEQGIQAPGRSLIWVITAMIAVGISMLRACMER
ncbi:MAG: hypothetical protein ABFS41_05790 [Myxococcota bacterium]